MPDDHDLIPLLEMPTPVARRYDAALARLKRTAARRMIEELREKGITLTVADGRLWARGPQGSVVNGTAMAIDKYKAWLIEVLNGNS